MTPEIAHERLVKARHRLRDVRDRLHEETTRPRPLKFKIYGLQNSLLIAQQSVAKAMKDFEKAERLNLSTTRH